MRQAIIQFLTISIIWATSAAWGDENPIEIHDHIVHKANESKQLALTLDACSGEYDNELIQFLVEHQIPATLFVTKKWLDRNRTGVAVLKSHLDLFQIEDHGENHIPAVIGVGRTVYGIPGEPDLMHLRREISEGAKAIRDTFGVTPSWYRGATAEYDAQAIREIKTQGYKVAGFSINADEGARMKRQAIVERLKHVRDGDIIIAHMNKPASDSAEGIAVTIADLVKSGYTFVRLDQVTVEPVPSSLPAMNRTVAH